MSGTKGHGGIVFTHSSRSGPVNAKDVVNISFICGIIGCLFGNAYVCSMVESEWAYIPPYSNGNAYGSVVESEYCHIGVAAEALESSPYQVTVAELQRSRVRRPYQCLANLANLARTSNVEKQQVSPL